MYTPRRLAVWLRSLGGATARPCGINTEFCGGDQYSDLVHLLLGGVTAMLHGLYARLCRTSSYRAMHYIVQSAALRSHVVCPSVCPSVTLVDHDHIG